MLIVEKVIGRKFDVTGYGVCFIEDVLDDIPESVLKVRLWYTDSLVQCIPLFSLVNDVKIKFCTFSLFIL